ncbi:carboxypeptidase-like regulatory domain-containing protein [Mucilaginibacter ximonensis]|uniref:Carboxypeptidase-like regulatory domain-containing protein n=1 Tax=Mucilaginibacter ximonensis TaxID=538021 RepID=A0ABW5YE87_9SPHI
MKPFFFIFSLFVLLLTGSAASGQGNYAISGNVTDDKGAPLKSATVFISGSQKIMMCDAGGHFKFEHLNVGNYQLTVTMIGYVTFSQNVAIQNKSAHVDIQLKIQDNQLAEVRIGGKDNFEKHYQTFKELFLGKTKNGRACTIINPRVLNFSTKKKILFADASDFLIIENPRLGYRIKYLLKQFSYNSNTGITLYTGETNFEPMKGTPQMQATWDKNRLAAYKGSLMHFLRSVYRNRVLREGFIINPILERDDSNPPIITYDARPVAFDTLRRIVDSSFVGLRFKRLLYSYDPSRAKTIQTNITTPVLKERLVDNDITQITLFNEEAIIDQNGAHRDYRDFLVEGSLGANRVGDQLPFEYQPPNLTLVTP